MAKLNGNDNLDRASQVVLRVLEQVGKLTPSTKVVKLVYLVDYTYFQHYGETLSGLEYQWDHYGPNALDHAIVGRADSLTSDKLLERTARTTAYGGPMYLYRLAETTYPARLSDAGEMVINDIVAQYGMLSVQAITNVSKKTAPFAKAEQYDLLEMEHSIPALSALEFEWDGYLAELHQQGTVSLEDLLEEHGLA